MADDIVTRLRDLLDGPVPMTIERADVRDAADEIERLRHERGATHEPHADAVQAEPADVVPRITDEQRRQVADAETLTAALWELSEIYRVPLTNNVPFFDNGDPAAPVFHVGDWIQDLIDVFARFPQPQDGPHGR